MFEIKYYPSATEQDLWKLNKFPHIHIYKAKSGIERFGLVIIVDHEEVVNVNEFHSFDDAKEIADLWHKEAKGE